MQHTNSNTKHTNVMQQVTFMQINCNNQDFDPMVTQFNSIRLADDADLDALKTQIGTKTFRRLLKDYSPENFRVYSINTKDGYTGTLELFITEAFANLIKGIITAFTDDECFDYTPFRNRCFLLYAQGTNKLQQCYHSESSTGTSTQNLGGTLRQPDPKVCPYRYNDN